VLPLAASDVKNGVINFAKAYVNVDEYKKVIILRAVAFLL